MEYALLNGQLLPATEVRLPLPNRGLKFNDGFFETMVYQRGRVQWLPDHLSRMHQAAAVLKLTLSPALATRANLEGSLNELLSAAGLQNEAARLRLQVWRGGGGLYAPASSAAEWLATAAPFVPNDTPIGQAGFGETVRTHFSPVSFCKGPYALHYVLAAQERDARGLDEIFLLDVYGHVAEAVAAAVFWIKDEVLFTPALESGCVAGVRRAHLLRVAEAQGVKCVGGLFLPPAVQAADAVFVANVAGIRLVAQVAETKINSAGHPLLTTLRRWDTAT